MLSFKYEVNLLSVKYYDKYEYIWMNGKAQTGIEIVGPLHCLKALLSVKDLPILIPPNFSALVNYQSSNRLCMVVF